MEMKIKPDASFTPGLSHQLSNKAVSAELASSKPNSSESTLLSPPNADGLTPQQQVQANQQTERMGDEPHQSSEQQMEQLELLFSRLNRQLRFEVTDETGESIVQIIDKETGDVVRQIPAQELLDINHNLKQYAPSSIKQIL